MFYFFVTAVFWFTVFSNKYIRIPYLC